jgi:hypothetical protein
MHLTSRRNGRRNVGVRLALATGAVLVLGAAALAGCSKSSPKEGAVGPGELGDEALVTYSAPDGTYSFKHPQSWTQDTAANGSLRFAGRDAFVGVELKANAGADAMAFATADKTAVANDFAGYKELSLNVSTEVTNAAVLSFEWDAGSSAVTGKPVRARVDRYYIPVSAGRIAVMTGSEPVSAFDRETVRDVALTVTVN